jgi:hypothetical protein
MVDAAAPRRKPGRPRLPQEIHRRTVKVQVRPALLRRLEAAANAASHSLSREIEARCEAYEGLRVVHEEKVTNNEEWWLLKLDKVRGDLSVVHLPTEGAVDKGNEP